MRVFIETDVCNEMLMQFSFEVSRSAVVVDNCDRRRPSTGSGVMIGGGLELVGSLKSHVFRVRSCHSYFFVCSRLGGLGEGRKLH